MVTQTTLRSHVVRVGDRGHDVGSFEGDPTVGFLPVSYVYDPAERMGNRRAVAVFSTLGGVPRRSRAASSLEY
jgi:hypothetical protein